MMFCTFWLVSSMSSSCLAIIVLSNKSDLLESFICSFLYSEAIVEELSENSGSASDFLKKDFLLVQEIPRQAFDYVSLLW
jgi:hypothetical protein